MHVLDLRPDLHHSVDGAIQLSIIDELAAAGCNVNVAPVKKARSILARAAGIGDLRALFGPDAVARATEHLAEQILTTPMDPDDVTREVTRIAGLADTDGTAGRILTRAARLADIQVSNALSAYGDAWVTNVIRPAAQTLLDRIRQHAATLDPAITRSTLHTASATDQDAFTDAGRAAADLTELHRLADTLRNEGLIPTARTGPSWQYWFLHTDRLPAYPASRDLTSWWLDAISGGADPGVFTDADLDSATAAA